MPAEVYESEVSSIVAYALNSYEYKRVFEERTGRKPASSAEQTPSPVHKRKGLLTANEGADLSSSAEKSGILSFLRAKDKDPSPASGNSVSNNGSNVEEPPPDKTEDAKKNKLKQNIDLQFEDSSCRFFCRIYYAEQFARLRRTVVPSGEEAYVRSLSRSVGWNARGGKSGSTFYKTAGWFL